MVLFTLRQMIALFVMSMLFLFEYFSLNILNVLEPHIANEFNCSSSKIGWLGSSYFYAMVILLIPAGYIVDKYPLKKIVIFAALAGALGTFLLSISETYTHLIISRFIVGSCLGPFALISCIKYISQAVSRKMRGIYINLIFFTGIFGGALSQNIFGKLVYRLGWRESLTIVSLVGICIAMLLFLLIKDCACQFERRSIFTNDIKDFIAKSDIYVNVRVGAIAAILNMPLFIFGSLFGITFLEQVYGLTGSPATSITAKLFWGMLLGCAISSLLEYKFYKISILLLGLIISIITLTFLIFMEATQQSILNCLFAVIGISAGLHVVSFTLIEEVSCSTNVGLSEGFHSTIIFFGGAVIQPIFGKILDASNFYQIKSGIGVKVHMPYQVGLALLILLLLLGTYLCRGLVSIKRILHPDPSANTA